jgi:RHS repeat-associated protein
MKKCLLSLCSVLMCNLVVLAQTSSKPLTQLPEEVTLSNGKYVESFENDTLRRIGTVMFNTVTNKVQYFLADDDSRYAEAVNRPDETSRFLSLDPDEGKYPHLSPYCYAGNNPITLIDKDGRGPVDPKTGTRISSNVLNTDFWALLYLGGASKKPGPDSYDNALVQAGHSLGTGTGDEYKVMSEDHYKDKFLSKPYQTVLTVNNASEVVDLTDEIRISSTLQETTNNAKGLEKAGEGGNYIFGSSNWTNKDYTVYNVENGWINHEAKFGYDSKTKTYSLSEEISYTIVMSEEKTRIRPTGVGNSAMNVIEKYRDITVYERTVSYDKSGKSKVSGEKTYSYEKVDETKTN